MASWRKQRDGKARRGGVSWHYTTHIHIHTYVHTHTPPAHLQIEPARQHHINRRGKQDPRPVQNHPERVALVQYEGEHPGEENGPEPGPPWTAEADADEVVFDDDGEDGNAGDDGPKVEEVHRVCRSEARRTARNTRVSCLASEAPPSTTSVADAPVSVLSFLLTLTSKEKDGNEDFE